MSKPELLPPPAEPEPKMIPISVTLDADNLDWLDAAAATRNRNRSEMLREILMRVREQTTK